MLSLSKHAHPWSIGDAAVLLRRVKGKRLAGWGLRREGCRIFEPASSKHTPLMSSEVETRSQRQPRATCLDGRPLHGLLDTCGV